LAEKLKKQSRHEKKEKRTRKGADSPLFYCQLLAKLFALYLLT